MHPRISSLALHKIINQLDVQIFNTIDTYCIYKCNFTTMGDIDYSRIHDILVLHPCVVGFALCNLCDIYFLQMALVVLSVFVVWRYTEI